MSDDDLLPEFLAETSDLIEKIYQDLDSCESNPAQKELMDRLFRNVHTIKGGSSMFNFSNMSSVAHELENYLSKIKSKPDFKKISPEDVQHSRTEIQKIESLLKNKDQPQVEETVETNSSSSNKAVDDFIRVPLQKVTETVSGIAEVFLVRNQIVYLIERYKAGLIDQIDFIQGWDQLDGTLRKGIANIERSAMGMRMTSIQGVFARMARVIQSYKAPGKKIEFLTQGETTELDKKVLDALGEPLIHVIRNAMDHGIESMDDRKRAGKPLIGRIFLSAGIVGNEAVIEISDDGKGIDPKKILSSAQKKGLDVSKVTDDKSAMELIFLPGFSTAETITDVSGRGVGMDAVKTSVQSLGGRVLIDSTVGKGTTFTIKLPVSVSLMPVLLVDIKGSKYAVPNHDIFEIRQTKISNITSNSGKNFVAFRNEFIECLDLREKLEPGVRDPQESISECSLVFIKNDEKPLAARVSHFGQNIEIIVKPPSKLLPKIPWITGVSVLPTGEAIFVLSVSRLCKEKISYEAA